MFRSRSFVFVFFCVPENDSIQLAFTKDDIRSREMLVITLQLNNSDGNSMQPKWRAVDLYFRFWDKYLSGNISAVHSSPRFLTVDFYLRLQ